MDSAKESRRSASADIDDHRNWFDGMYRNNDIPWDRGVANALLTESAPESGNGRRALVVGCGHGADAEFLSGRGFTVTAFDFVAAAIAGARERFPASKVDYRTADLLHPPAEWVSQFDYVVESLTVQSLPRQFRAEATNRVREFLAPGATLLVIASVREADTEYPDGPWPLTRAELEAFACDDVRLEHAEELSSPHRWRAQFHRA